MHRWSAILLSALVVAGCNEQDSSTPGTLSDASGPDATVDMSADAAASDVRPTPDAAPDADGTPDAFSPDSSHDSATADAEPDVAPADLGPDANADPYAGRPTGMCADDADCPASPSGPDCSSAFPGGVCLGCGTDSHCPIGTICTNFGSCAFPCAVDDECPPGQECSSARGACMAIRCDAAGNCPVPLLECGALNQCARVDCSNDPNVCPSDTTCTGGVCVEDRFLNR